MFKRELVDVLKQTGWFLAAVLVLAGGHRRLARCFGEVLPGHACRRPPGRPSLLGPFSGGLAPIPRAGATGGRIRALSPLFAPGASPAPGGRAVLRPRRPVDRLRRSPWNGGQNRGRPERPVLGTLALFVYSLALFAIAFSLSTLVENFIALCLLSGFLAWLAFSLQYLLSSAAGRTQGVNIPVASKLFRDGLPAGPFGPGLALALVPVFLTAIPFGAAVLQAFPKFDLRPSGAYKRRYFGTLGIALAAGVLTTFALSFLQRPDRIQFTTFITSDLKVVEFGGPSIHIHSPAGVQRVRSSFPASWPVPLDNGLLVFLDVENRILILDPIKAETRLLHDPAMIKPLPGALWTYGDKVAFLGSQGSPRTLSLNIVEANAIGTPAIRSIPWAAGIGPGSYFPSLFGTGIRDGRRFWLFSSSLSGGSPLRLWEDGRRETISAIKPKRLRSIIYVNDLIIVTAADGLSVFRDGNESFEPVRTIQDSFACYPANRGRMADQPRAEALYGKRGDRVARLDLRTLEITDIARLKTPIGVWLSLILPDRFFFFENDLKSGVLTVSEVRSDRLERLGELIDFDSEMEMLDVQREGIVRWKGNKVEAYAFPNLKRIDY